MQSQGQKIKSPWIPPQWLLEAAKKRSGVPVPPVDEAFLKQLQHAREHPGEVERKAREDAIRSGRDPDAFAKMMADVRKNALRVHPAQRPNEVRAEVTIREKEYAVESVGTVEAERNPTNETRAAVQNTATTTLPTAHEQCRVSARISNTRKVQMEKRDERREKKENARRKSKADRKTSSQSGTASPIEMDDIQPTIESSASGAVRKPVTGAAPVPANPNPSNTPNATASYPFPTRSTMPTWYTSISAKSLAQLDRKRPQELASIDALKNCIKRCEEEKNKSKLNKTYNELRNHVYKAEIKLQMDKIKVRKTRILTETGLPRIFNKDAEFPLDLKADAWHLYERWMDEDFEQDILRGIVTVKGKDRNGDRIDPAYREKHPKDPKFFGGEGVVIGQWWPTQLCTVRDGVHGAAQGGKLVCAYL
jgi:hypothetical protein